MKVKYTLGRLLLIAESILETEEISRWQKIFDSDHPSISANNIYFISPFSPSDIFTKDTVQLAPLCDRCGHHLYAQSMRFEYSVKQIGWIVFCDACGLTPDKYFFNDLSELKQSRLIGQNNETDESPS